MSGTELAVPATGKDADRPVRFRGIPTRRQIAIVVLLVACAVVPPWLTRAFPGVFTDLQASRVGIGATFAAMALSLNLLMGYAGQISLGHGALLSVGAYASGIVTGRLGLPFLTGLLLAAALGAMVAFIVGMPALRLRGLYLAIATLGLALMMQESILQIPALSRGSAGVELPRPQIGTFVFTRNADYLAIVLVVFVLLWLLDRNVVASKLGRAYHGIREDEQIAQSFGVDVGRYKLGAFALSGAVAGVAGALEAHRLLFVDSRSFDLNLSLLLVAIVVIGGLGSRMGVAIAAFAFGFLPEILRMAGRWDQIIGAALLIFTMARHPGGVAGAIRETKHAAAARRARAGTDDAAAATEVPPLPDLPPPAGLARRATVAEGSTLLEIADLTVRFGGLVAVDEVSLTVPQGRIVGLIGPNGAGKTTLFNAVSGFNKPTAGAIHLAGQPLHDLGPHDRTALGLGRTFQLVGLAANLSMEENLLLAQHPLANYGTVGALMKTRAAHRVERELGERARTVIGALGFEHLADLPVKHLSGGQQRIVEMACALVTTPELLLLDEPSAGMAPAAVENLADRLREIRDCLGRTVLLIEHNIPLVLDVCDEIYVLSSGRLLAHGSPDDITTDRTVVEAYLGSAAASEVLA